MPTAFLCVTCGTEYPPSLEPPSDCPICLDERQYVGLQGQQWTTLDDLRGKHSNEFIELEPGLTAIKTQPPFGIAQRAFLVQTPEGNILWDCIALLDQATETCIRDRGGLSAIAISHPHYYTTMDRWSAAFGSVPVYLHSADREHVVNPSPHLHFWSGETLPLNAGTTLIRCGGHFEGSTVLHWSATADSRGAILSGDTIQVVPDRRWVSFMYSYPNLIPLPARVVQRIVDAVEPYPFDRVYGAFDPMQVAGDGRNVIRRSAERYIRAIKPD